MHKVYISGLPSDLKDDLCADWYATHWQRPLFPHRYSEPGDPWVWLFPLTFIISSRLHARFDFVCIFSTHFSCYVFFFRSYLHLNVFAGKRMLYSCFGLLLSQFFLSLYLSCHMLNLDLSILVLDTTTIKFFWFFLHCCLYPAETISHHFLFWRNKVTWTGSEGEIPPLGT